MLGEGKWCDLIAWARFSDDSKIKKGIVLALMIVLMPLLMIGTILFYSILWLYGITSGFANEQGALCFLTFPFLFVSWILVTSLAIILLIITFIIQALLLIFSNLC